MSVKLTWLPNAEAAIAKYELWKSADNTNFTLLVEVDHDLGNAALFDNSIGRFYYEDATGLDTDWFKVRAVDAVGNLSSFTVSKQAGPSLPAVCVLFGTILRADGSPETEAQIQIFIQNTEKTKEGQFVSGTGVTSLPIEVFTDDNGFWEAEIIRQSTVRVVIPKINLDTELTIPDSASAEITTLV